MLPIVEACQASGSTALVGAPVLDGDEPNRFSPGAQPVVLDVDGWRGGTFGHLGARCGGPGPSRTGTGEVALATIGR